MPSAIVLSHAEQLSRLSAVCPEAVPRALVAGDPCFDRLVASVPWREDYRTALGVRPGRRLIVVTSTWGPGSLLGRRPELFARLLAELPVDEYRVAAVVHPNVWHGHGPWQLRAWLADCRRAGLVMLPPRDGWRAALVAADCVIGDHGSVSLYGAALGRPVLLGSFAHDEIDPATAMAELGRRAPRVRDDRPIKQQIERAIAGHSPGASEALADRAFAARGAAAGTLREAMYRLLGLAPPRTPVRVPPVPPPVPEPPAWDHAERPALVAAASLEDGGGRARVRVERYPAELDDLRSWSLPDPHLVVDGTEPDPRLRGLADIVVHRFDARRGPGLTDEDHRRIVAEVTADDTCHVRLPGGPVLELRAESPGLDPGVTASAIHALVASGRRAEDLSGALTVVVGSADVLVRVQAISR